MRKSEMPLICHPNVTPKRILSNGIGHDIFNNPLTAVWDTWLQAGFFFFNRWSWL
jgi:hypothetical protein